MIFALHALITFAGGAIFEGGNVFWVHYSEAGRPWATAFVSMVVAAASLAGIDESVHDLFLAPFFVLGYGAGSFAAVKWKDRSRPRTDPNPR